MECCLFLLGTPLGLVCLRWTPFAGVLHMGLEFLLVMAQGNQVIQSWHLQSIRANIWLQWLKDLPKLDGIILISTFSGPLNLQLYLSSLYWFKYNCSVISRGISHVAVRHNFFFLLVSVPCSCPTLFKELYSSVWYYLNNNASLWDVLFLYILFFHLWHCGLNVISPSSPSNQYQWIMSHSPLL